ncbi:MAG: ATP-binding cassette domain-containing protein [Arcanobacterium sp.]|nr:ATP-binding cassette domain-containing protein [Arcanobacterium sp.]
MYIREGKNLTFDYGANPVLCGLNLSLPVGITGLVGPNGAGKTTALKILAGVTKPKDGHIFHKEKQIRTSRDYSVLRKKTGFLPQNPTWTTTTSISDFVEYCYRMNGGKGNPKLAVERALTKTNTLSLRDRMIGKISGGERRRAFLAGAIVHSPEVLILDEPSVGLDPEQRIEFRKMLAELKNETAILISTHIIEDLRGISSNLVVINHGKQLWSGSIDKLASLGNSSEDVSDLEAGYLHVLGN